MNDVIKTDLYLTFGVFVIALFVTPLAIKNNPSLITVIWVPLLIAAIFFLSRLLIAKISKKKIGISEMITGVILLAAGVYIFYTRKDKLLFLILFSIGIIGFVQGLFVLIKKEGREESPTAFLK